MTEQTYIFGHRNPDADSICSAIAYAAFKRATGQEGYVPARCGNSNARIDAILARFGVPMPVFVGDVTPRVRDIMQTEVLRIESDAPCAGGRDGHPLVRRVDEDRGNGRLRR